MKKNLKGKSDYNYTINYLLYQYNYSNTIASYTRQHHKNV